MDYILCFYIALLCNKRWDFYFGASAELLVKARDTEKQADVVTHMSKSSLVKRNMNSVKR